MIKRKLARLDSKKPKITNCPVCGRAYVDSGNNMCRDCYDKEKQMQLEVTIYVREHPDCTAGDIIEATGASPGVVRRMMQEGHFVMNDVSAVSYPCAQCGKPIIVGRLCGKCAESMQKKMVKVKQEMMVKIKQNGKAKKDENGMYIVKALGLNDE